MKKIADFYRIKYYISEAETMYDLDYCEYMVNLLQLKASSHLADLILFKRVTIISTVYSHEIE